MNLEQTQQKIKITVNKQLWDVLSGQISIQRRSSLPLLSIGSAVQAKFNRAAQKIIQEKFVNFYKLSNGMLLIEFGKEGQLAVTKYSDTKRGITTMSVSAGRLRKYIFNEMKIQKLQYHFYLHPTDRPNLYVLKEITNSWE